MRDPAHDLAAVVVHGFSGSMTRPAVDGVAEGLRCHAGVVMVDLRGHGRSTGVCTFGDREVFDVDAAVGEARRLGYRHVVTVGWSMGGSAVLRHAALARTGAVVHGRRLRHLPDAVVSVSATSRWFVRDTAPMRRLHWLAETATGRIVARLVMKVRIAPDGWTAVPAPPVELIARIAPIPCLIVHGDRDAYFTLEHPRALAEAAGGAAELWLVPGYGHAEASATPGLLDRIGGHLEDLLAGRAERSEPAAGIPRQAGPVAPGGLIRRIGWSIGAGGGVSASGRRRAWRG